MANKSTNTKAFMITICVVNSIAIGLLTKNVYDLRTEMESTKESYERNSTSIIDDNTYLRRDFSNLNLRVEKMLLDVDKIKSRVGISNSDELIKEINKSIDNVSNDQLKEIMSIIRGE